MFECRKITDIGKLGYRRRVTNVPDNPHIFTAKWYCESEECVVREVEISVKLLDPGDKEPKKLICPACRERTLTFHGYVEWDEIRESEPQRAGQFPEPVR